MFNYPRFNSRHVILNLVAMGKGMKKKRKYVKSGKYKKVEAGVSISGGIPEGMKLPKSKTTTSTKEIAYVNKEGRVFYKFTPNKLRGEND